jgi:hypothetical protein
MLSRPCPVLMTAFVSLFVLFAAPRSPAQETPRVEVGVHVTALNLGDFRLRVPDLRTTERGAGGRITININDSVALEGEYNIFPNDFRITVPQLGQLVTRRLTRDRVNQIMFGVKAGARSDRWGIFAKLRPGFIRSSLRDETINPNASLNTLFRSSTGIALDIGGVLEFYPTRNTVLRFDVGDLIMRYENKALSNATGATPVGRFTHHSLQIGAGVGLRF